MRGRGEPEGRVETLVALGRKGGEGRLWGGDESGRGECRVGEQRGEKGGLAEEKGVQESCD